MRYTGNIYTMMIPIIIASAVFGMGLCVLTSPVSAAPIVANFTANVTLGTAPMPVLFTDSSTGSPTHWSWFFGDERYTEDWTDITGIPGWAARVSHTGVVLPNSSIIIMGGAADGRSASPFNDTWLSTDQGSTWTLQNASSGWAARYEHESVVLSDGSIILAGGINSSAYSDVWRSTDQGKTWVQQTASAGWPQRYSAALVALPDDHLVIMGGTEPLNTLYNDSWLSTDQGKTWVQQAASAGWQGRRDLKGVSLPDGSIVVTGGRNATSIPPVLYNDTWLSTDQGATWGLQNASSGWAARYGFSLVTMPDSSIILAGGSTGSLLLNDVWRSTDKGATWTQLDGGAEWSARGGMPALALPDGSVVIIGGQVGYVDSNETWRMQPVVSSTQTPTHTYSQVGTYNVSLTAYNASSYNTLLRSAYITVTVTAPAPTVTGITPSSGQNTTTVSIRHLAGTNFISGATVNLTMSGQANITSGAVTVVGPTNITTTFDLNGKKVGLWNVNVTNPDGKEGSLVGGFSVTNVTPAPTVTGITPSSGQNTTTISITHLAGTNFISGATVNLTMSGQANITSGAVTVVGPTNITTTFDLNGKKVGLWNVNVTNPDGKEGSLVGGFSVTNVTLVTAKIGVYQNGGWYLDNNGNGTYDGALIDKNYNFGGSGNVSVVGDWNGDNKTEIGVTNGINWYLDDNGNGTWDGTGTGNDKYGYFGISGYTPVVGDWNGDNKTEIGVTNGIYWYLDNNGNGVWDGIGPGNDTYGYFGISGYTPVVGDWNGDKKTEIGVTNSIYWYLDNNGNGVWDGTGTGNDTQGYFGISGYTPVVGDWNGDKKTEIGVTNSVDWYLDNNGNGVWDGTGTGNDTQGYFNYIGYTPVIGDWNGDNKTEIGVTNSVDWYLDNNGNGVWDGTGTGNDKYGYFGITGWTPVVGKW